MCRGVPAGAMLDPIAEGSNRQMPELYRPGEMSMENQDLRSWLARMEAAGELQHVSGAERMEEIGGIVDIYQRKMGRQALLFDDVPGYPRGYRVLANVLTSVRRIAMTLGLPDDATEMDLVRYWRNYIGGANTHKPEVVKTGKLMRRAQDVRKQLVMIMDR